MLVFAREVTHIITLTGFRNSTCLVGFQTFSEASCMHISRSIRMIALVYMKFAIDITLPRHQQNLPATDTVYPQIQLNKCT